MIIQGQRGRIEDQRCSFDPSKSAPCTPTHTDLTLAPGTLNTDECYEHIWNCKSWCSDKLYIKL